MEQTLASLVAEVLKLGLPGLALIALSCLYWIERRERREAQECRISEQKILIELVTSTRFATESLEDAMKILSAEVRGWRK